MFKGIYFNEHSDFLDYDNSKYEEVDWSIFPEGSITDRMKKVPAFIEELILTEPADGFPPCFMLLADPAKLLVTEQCREAIVNAKINHVMFSLIGDY